MKKSILSFDYHIQLIAFVLILTTSVLIFPLFLLVPFGAYQVLSAGIKGLALDKYRHRVFALAAGLYGAVIMYIAVGDNEGVRDFFNLFASDFQGTLIFFAYFFIPIVSAIFYIRLSYKDWQEEVEQEEQLDGRLV